MYKYINLNMTTKTKNKLNKKGVGLYEKNYKSLLRGVKQ